MKRQLVLHPLLLAAFQVMYLFARNVQEGISLDDFLRPLGLVVGLTALLMIAATLLLRNAQKAGLAVSALVLLFFSYGYMYAVAQGRSIGGLQVGDHRVLLPLWIALAVASVIGAIRAGRRLLPLTKALNAAAAGLVLINLATIVAYKVDSGPTVSRPPLSGSRASGRAAPDPITSGQVASDRSRPPDIYYIVPDTYAGERTLREQFGFDNGPFLDALEDMGFYVASTSTSNYPRTIYSLASSLNMDYLDFLTEQFGADSSNKTPMRELIQDPRVGRFLQARGYQYIHIGSWWEVTATSAIADRQVDFGGLSEFSSSLFGTTALSGLDFRHREYARVQYQFDQLFKTQEDKSPKFVFAHFLMPHEPFVVDRNGEFLTDQELASRSRAENYVEEVMYANTKLLELVGQLLAGPEDSDPVIILQADEGPYAGEPTRWSTWSASTLERKFRILNAYYLPGVANPGLYPSITPVNSFRVVFDVYFDADLPLLEDENYVFESFYGHLYSFIHVTDELD